MKAWAKIILTSALVISSQARADDLASVKAKIFSLAESYMGQTDVDGTKAKRFEPLIEELLALSPPQSMQQKAVTAVGAWKQVWGPYSYKNSGAAPQGLEPDQIYQVISPSGFYTNVGVYKIFGFYTVGLLKGQYTVTSEKINVEFKQSGVLIGKVPQGYTLADLPALKEQGQIHVLEFPKFLPPVGIQGALVEVYDDEDLRITFGEQKGRAGRTLYVMKRVRALPY